MTTRPDDYTTNNIHLLDGDYPDPHKDQLPGLFNTIHIVIGEREHPCGQRYFLIRTIELRETEYVTQAWETNQHVNIIQDGPIINVIDDQPNPDEVEEQLLQLLNRCQPLDITPIGKRMFFPDGQTITQDPPPMVGQEIPPTGIMTAQDAEQIIKEAVEEGRAEEVAAELENIGYQVTPPPAKPSPKKKPGGHTQPIKDEDK